MVEIIQNGKCFLYIYTDRAIAMVFFTIPRFFLTLTSLIFFFNQCFVCGFRWSVLCISAFCKHIKLRNMEESCSGFTFWSSGLASYNIIWFALFLNEGASSGDFIGYTCLSYIARFWAVRLSLLTINLQTLCSLLWRKNSHTQRKSLCKIDLL